MVDMNTWKTSVFVSDVDVDTVLNGFMIQGNKDIFDDMAWAHQAYASSGIWALRYAKEDQESGEPDDTDYDAWNLINEGIHGEDIVQLREGNRLLLFREQDAVMQPRYNTMKEIWLNPGSLLEQFLATIGGIVYPPRNEEDRINIDEMFSLNARNPVHFTEGPWLREAIPGGLLSDFNNRWYWIENASNGMLPIWLGTSTSVTGFSEANRANLNGTVFWKHALVYSMLPPNFDFAQKQFPSGW